ncbi:hypothetical protein JCM5353_000020 [Sporobolomyces roseus]
MTCPSASTSDESISTLQSILARPNPLELSEQDLHLILPHLTSSPSLHSLSLAILSRSTSPSPSPLTLQFFQSTLHSLLSGTNSSDLITGLSTLSALLQVSPQFVNQLLLDKEDESFRLVLRDTVEHISRPIKSKGGKGKEKEKEEQKALVELLSLASGQIGMRKLVRESAGEWMESLLKENGDSEVKAMAAVGMVKLRLGKKDLDSTTGIPRKEEEEDKPSKWSLEDLAKLFVDLVVGEKDKATKGDDRVLVSSLEGLAYLTLTPSPEIKRIASQTSFLDIVFSFASTSTTTKSSQSPTSSNAARDYAIATLLHHITKFSTPEDAQSEAAQVERLKRFASAGGGGGKNTNLAPSESVEQVTSRVISIVKHSTSPIPTIRLLCLSPSLQTRRLAGQILHSFVTPPTLRGQLLQSGVARLLLTLIRNIPTPFDPTLDLAPVQALSKLFITSNPLLIFGPTPASPLLFEASQAITLPLGPSSSVPLLAIFESLMALTNIASLSPELTDRLTRLLTLRDRTSSSNQLLNAVEELLVNENKMVRRAAIELVCNLVASEKGIEYFEPSTQISTSTNRLHLLLALSSSEDVSTRLAATGALTSLVCSKEISISLVTTEKYVELMLGGLEDDEPGVRHRVYEVWRGIGEVLGEVEGGEERVRVREKLGKGNVVKELEKVREREDVVELRESIEGAIEGIKKLLN